MQLQVNWQEPILLTETSPDSNQIYGLSLESIPEKAGVYIFMRRFGDNRSPLYIGQAINLRTRIKQQLNAVSLMKGIQNADKGYRELVVGLFAPKKGQQEAKCLTLIENALIRHFISKGHELLNKSGTKLKKHALASRGVTGAFIQADILFE